MRSMRLESLLLSGPALARGVALAHSGEGVCLGGGAGFCVGALSAPFRSAGR